METQNWQIQVNGGTTVVLDMLGDADRILNELCEKLQASPIAVLTAALIYMQNGKPQNPVRDGSKPRGDSQR